MRARNYRSHRADRTIALVVIKSCIWLHMDLSGAWGCKCPMTQPASRDSHDAYSCDVYAVIATLRPVCFCRSENITSTQQLTERQEYSYSYCDVDWRIVHRACMSRGCQQESVCLRRMLRAAVIDHPSGGRLFKSRSQQLCVHRQDEIDGRRA